MNDIKSLGISTTSVGNMTQKLSSAYCDIINKKLPLKLIPSVMLWGAPGVGKSQAVRQIAKMIENNTSKKVVVTDVRLLLFNPIDLRGIPTSNADKTLAIWLKPQIFQMSDSEDIVNILFLDEISAAPQSVQAAAYQITLDRTVGEHALPENCIVIAAGNRVTDKSVAYKMPKALANRLLHIEIEGDFDSWKKWAIKSGINEKVIGFLSFRRDRLMQFNPSSEDLAFATPRSWEMVSNLLNNVDESIEQLYLLISGIIGVGNAIEFKTWCKVYKDLPNIEDIFEGKSPKVPAKPDAMYALVSSMTEYAKKHKDDLNRISNSIDYAQQLPPDFFAVMMKDYLNIEENYQQKLLSIPSFASWTSKNGSFMNGYIK